MKNSYIGKKHISAALDLFHASHPKVQIAVNITRHPFSFRGDAPLDDIPDDYFTMQMSSLQQQERPSTPSQLQRLGDAASINFNIDRTPFYNPLDSQRVLLWAARYGKQEVLAEVMAFDISTCAS